MRKKILLIVITTLFVFSCSEHVVENAEQNKNIEDYETAWSIANQVYPFFQLKKINWDSLNNKYKPLAQNAKGDEIYNVLFEMFKELKDGHIEIYTQGGFPLPTYLPPRNIDRKSFSQNIVSKYIGKEFRLAGNNNISYELFNNIGYIYFSTFSDGSWINDFDKVLLFLKESNGLIIDVRNNSGGSGTTTDFIIARFIDEVIQYKLFRNDGTDKMFTIQPISFPKYKKPVVVLINGASFSAAEMFPELLRQLSNVTIVGDTTGGGGGANQVYDLPSGKRIKMPYMYFTRFDGSMVEWNGVIPDIIIEQTEIDKNNGIDKQLEKAINILINK